jgi:hypothetical protein
LVLIGGGKEFHPRWNAVEFERRKNYLLSLLAEIVIC